MTEIDILARSSFQWADVNGDGATLVANGFNAWAGVFCEDGRWYAVGGCKEKRATLLAAKAKALTEQAQKEKSLAGVAATLKATVQKSAALSRTSNDPMLPAAVVQKLYDAPQGGIVSAPSGNGYVIAQVTGIVHPKPTGPADPQFRGHAQQLAGSVAGDFSISMANAERADQRVTVNQKLLDAATGGGT